MKDKINDALLNVGEYTLFFNRFFRNIFRKGFEWQEFMRQCFKIGNQTLGIILLTGFVIGFVLTLQSIPTLKDFGALSFTPAMVSVSVFRELGPVITALICAGKISSGIGAELGSMRVTEQIDAMEVSGANPTQYLVVTRILACFFMIPLLTIFANGAALLGGYLGMNTMTDMTMGLYFRKSFSALAFTDLFPSLIKTFFFGLAIGLIGCYKGIFSTGGTESVGEAAKSAVVTSSVWIIIIDAIAVQITNILYYQ